MGEATTVWDRFTNSWSYAPTPADLPSADDYVRDNYTDYINLPPDASSSEVKNARSDAKAAARQDFQMIFNNQMSAEELAWMKEKFGKELQLSRDDFDQAKVEFDKEFGLKERYFGLDEQKFEKEFGLEEEKFGFEQELERGKVGREEKLRQFALDEIGGLQNAPMDLGRTGEQFLYDAPRIPEPGQTYRTGGPGKGRRTSYGAPVLDMNAIKQLSDQFSQQIFAESRSEIDRASAEGEKAAISNILARGMGRSALLPRAKGKVSGGRAGALGSAARTAKTEGLRLGMQGARDVFSSEMDVWQNWFRGEQAKETQGKELAMRERLSERERRGGERKTRLTGLMNVLQKKF